MKLLFSYFARALEYIGMQLINWITLLLAISVDISLLKNYLKKMQSGFYVLLLVGQNCTAGHSKLMKVRA